MSQSIIRIRYVDSTFRALVALLLCPALLCGFLATPCTAEPNDTKVELKLEGQFIERLVLWPTQTFENPGQTIDVAPGKYRVKEVRLKGGYIYRYRVDTLIEVDTNEVASLKVGGPLRQKLTVQRRGGCLIVGHELLGVGGEKYPPNANRRPPGFTVYRGAKKISSHKFEYG